MVWKNGEKSTSTQSMINRQIIANRATNKKHEQELEAIERQIQEMRTRIEEETNREKSGKKVPKK